MNSPSIRLEKVENIIRLINKMAGSTEGVSLKDIMNEYNVCRRTAERMMNVVRALYPTQLEQVETDELYKSYRLQELYRQGPIKFSMAELACVKKAAKLAKRDKIDELANELEALELRLKSISKNKLKLDSEYISELEDMSMVAGPRYTIDKTIISTLREAITGWQQLDITYKSRSDGCMNEYKIKPYGILYGRRPYLVAYLDSANDYRYFCITNIQKASLMKEHFSRDENFSLQRYAERSFGSFQEKPVKVVWRVDKDKADEALSYQFHPSQKIEKQKDGSLIVEFEAGGMKEMCYHLFSWEGSIEIVEPIELKNMMIGLLDKVRCSIG